MISKLLLCVRVYRKTGDSRFIVVHKNLVFSRLQICATYQWLPIFRSLTRMIWIPTVCGSNKMALRVTQRSQRWIFCASDFQWMIILHVGNVNRSPRSCDLTPLGDFFWNYFKSQIYTNKLQTIDALRVNITNVIQEIQPDMCSEVIENWISRIRECMQSRSGHSNGIIFHT